jgi:hypothetical protein
MNIFHEVIADQTVSNTLGTVSLTGLGLGVLFALTGGLLQWKNKSYKLAIIVAFTVLGLAVVVAGTAAVRASSESAAAREKTSTSLQSWSKDNYGINLSRDNANALTGLGQRPKAIAVDYKGQPTVVQLVDYKDGYILVNNKNQEVLPQK